MNFVMLSKNTSIRSCSAPEVSKLVRRKQASWSSLCRPKLIILKVNFVPAARSFPLLQTLKWQRSTISRRRIIAVEIGYCDYSNSEPGVLNLTRNETCSHNGIFHSPNLLWVHGEIFSWYFERSQGKESGSQPWLDPFALISGCIIMVWKFVVGLVEFSPQFASSM